LTILAIRLGNLRINVFFVSLNLTKLSRFKMSDMYFSPTLLLCCHPEVLTM